MSVNVAEEPTRTERKRRAIVEAATALFLRHGYGGASMDQVAALAAVSKQTVYKQFADKERLFQAVVSAVSGTVDAFIADLQATLGSTGDLPRDLQALARRYIRAVMQPRILQLRRVMIGEANRFPELGREYYERGPERVIQAFASAFEVLARRQLLRVDDPLRAAQHFAFLVLSIPMDRALVCGDEDGFTAADLDSIADAGVQVFLAAYGT
jgi:TetR/AcrR family transcriptional repressor of mexJK operon